VPAAKVIFHMNTPPGSPTHTFALNPAFNPETLKWASARPSRHYATMVLPQQPPPMTLAMMHAQFTTAAIEIHEEDVPQTL
jgi:hypothetical protein